MPRQAPVTFNIDAFDKAVDDLGLPMVLESAIVCSCVNPDTGHPDFSCNRCHGTGVDYLDPVQEKAVVSGLTGSEKVLNSPGFIMPGTAYCTTKSNVILGWRDRITFPNIHSKFSENLTFVGGKLTLPRKLVKQLLAVKMGDENVALNKLKLVENVLEWVDPNIPTDGTKLSVLYYTSPRYIVENMMHELRASITNVKSAVPYVVELPKQAQIKREDFVFVTSPTSSAPETEIVADSDTW